MKVFFNEIKLFLDGKKDFIPYINSNNSLVNKIKRQFSLYDDNVQKILIDIFPRCDISFSQMQAILADNRIQVSISSPLIDIIKNPYIIFEEYIGINDEDVIPFYKIDNGILPSPDFGLEQILPSDSPERLRALCVDELNHIASHSFGKALTILETINRRLDNMPIWKKHHYVMKNFDVDYNILEKAIHIRKDNDNIVW